jgi:hypothetical protein
MGIEESRGEFCNGERLHDPEAQLVGQATDERAR